MSDVITLLGLAALVAGAFVLGGLGIGLIVLGVALLFLGIAYADVRLPKVLQWRRS
jgi:hypothetical protein